MRKLEKFNSIIFKFLYFLFVVINPSTKKIENRKEFRRDKEVIFYVDSNHHRSIKIAQELINCGWSVTYVGQKVEGVREVYTKCVFEHNLRKITNIIDNRHPVLVHLFSSAVSLNLSLIHI